MEASPCGQRHPPGPQCLTYVICVEQGYVTIFHPVPGSARLTLRALQDTVNTVIQSCHDTLYRVYSDTILYLAGN